MNSLLDGQLVRKTESLVKIDSAISRYVAVLFLDARSHLGQQEVKLYLMFGAILALGYITISDGLFSVIITLGSVLHCLGLSCVLAKIRSHRSTSGISVKTLQMYVIVYAARLSATGFHEGYLPVDRSGDWAYQAADVVSLILVLILLHQCSRFGSHWTEGSQETFPVYLTCVASLISANYIHPCHNLNTMADVFWTFSVYMESFVMIPQLLIVSKSRGPVEAMTSHYIACTFLYRFMNFIFWYTIQDELVTDDNKSRLPGYCVVGALALQCIVLVDFMYYYLKALVLNRQDVFIPEIICVWSSNVSFWPNNSHINDRWVIVTLKYVSLWIISVIRDRL